MNKTFRDKIGPYGLTESETECRSVDLPFFGRFEWQGGEDEHAYLTTASLFASGALGEAMQSGGMKDDYRRGVELRQSALVTEIPPADRRRMRDLNEGLTKFTKVIVGLVCKKRNGGIAQEA